MSKEKNKGKLMDMSYVDVRKELRQYVNTNTDAYSYVTILSNRITNGLTFPNFYSYQSFFKRKDNLELIQNLLVDGFVAYEKIFNDTMKVIGLSAIDPITLTLGLDKKNSN